MTADQIIDLHLIVSRQLFAFDTLARGHEIQTMQPMSNQPFHIEFIVDCEIKAPDVNIHEKISSC